MKATVLIVIGCLTIFFGGYSFASGCGDSTGGCGGGGCNPFETSCQCTDPTCNNPWDSDCISRSYCCEAFGNVGGR